MKREKRDDIVARADEAFGNQNYAEFSVKKESRGKYRLIRLAVILGYFVILGGMCVLLAIKFPMGIAIMPIFGWMLVFFTWRYVSVDYKYTVDHATFTAVVVYGGKSERELVKFATKDLERVEPIENFEKFENIENIGNIENADKSSYTVIDARPSVDCTDAYVAVGRDLDGRPIALLFRATNGLIKALRFYNKASVVQKELSR